MTELDDPREQLRAIRSLMERATIYRMLSAPTALVGGLLSLGAWGLAWFQARDGGPGLTSREFLEVWLGVLGLTCVSNAFFLWRGAVGRGDAFLSAGMKAALCSVAPAFVAAGVFTVLVQWRPIDLCVLWILFYGMGLLATQSFAPRSLVLLGFGFFVLGCVLLILWDTTGQNPSTLKVSQIMAASFGGIHLIYAAAVWIRGEERSRKAAAHV